MYLAAGALLTQIIMAAQLTTPGLPRVHPPIVERDPYIASFQTQGSFSPGVSGGRGYIYRDSLGRTRVDFDLSEHEVRFIDDVTTNTLFIVDVRSGTYERDTYGPTSIDWTFSNVSAGFTEEHQNILGVECVCVRFKPVPETSNGNPGEAWISKSLGIVMKDTNPSQNWKWEVTNIEFREPDAATFQMPKSFREIEE